MDEDLKVILSLVHLIIMYGFGVPFVSYWISAYKNCKPEAWWLMATGLWLIAFSSLNDEGLKSVKKTWILAAIFLPFMSLRWFYL